MNNTTFPLIAGGYPPATGEFASTRLQRYAIVRVYHRNPADSVVSSRQGRHVARAAASLVRDAVLKDLLMALREVSQMLG